MRTINSIARDKILVGSKGWHNVLLPAYVGRWEYCGCAETFQKIVSLILFRVLGILYILHRSNIHISFLQITEVFVFLKIKLTLDTVRNFSSCFLFFSLIVFLRYLIRTFTPFSLRSGLWGLVYSVLLIDWPRQSRIWNANRENKLVDWTVHWKIFSC